MGSSESFHDKAGRRLLEAGMAQANDHMRVNATLHGKLLSHGAHGVIAGREVLEHLERVRAERAAAIRPAARPKAKRKPPAKGSASRAKAPKRKAGRGRKARARG